jgi:hypothetical protein
MKLKIPILAQTGKIFYKKITYQLNRIYLPEFDEKMHLPI